MSLVDELNQNINGTFEDSFFTEKNPEDTQLILFVLWGVILPLIATAGLVGNILTIMVLWRKEMHSTTIMYLRGMVITDTGILIGSVITLTPISCANYLHAEALRYFQYIVYPVIHAPGYYIIMTLQQCNVWITVSVSMERYIAICHPFRAARIITRRKTIIVLISIVIISLIYNIPHLFATRAAPCVPPDTSTSLIEVSPTAGDSQNEWYSVLMYSTSSTPLTSSVEEQSTASSISNCFGGYEVAPTEFANTQFYITFRTIMYSIIIYVIPFLALLILNSFLIKELMTMQQRRSGTNIHDENEANLSMVLVLIVIVFIFCQTPGLISQFDLIHNGAFYQWLGVSNVLFTTNSAVNFLIYTAFGRKFRRVLLLLFRHIFKKNRRQSQTSCRTTQYTNGDIDTMDSPTTHCSSVSFSSCYKKEKNVNGEPSENIPLNTTRDVDKSAPKATIQNVKYNNGGKRVLYTTEIDNCDDVSECPLKNETVSLVQEKKCDALHETGNGKVPSSGNQFLNYDNELTKPHAAPKLVDHNTASNTDARDTEEILQTYISDSHDRDVIL